MEPSNNNNFGNPQQSQQFQTGTPQRSNYPQMLPSAPIYGRPFSYEEHGLIDHQQVPQSLAPLCKELSDERFIYPFLYPGPKPYPVAFPPVPSLFQECNSDNAQQASSSKILPHTETLSTATVIDPSNPLSSSTTQKVAKAFRNRRPSRRKQQQVEPKLKKEKSFPKYSYSNLHEEKFLELNPDVEQSLAKQIYANLQDADVLDDYQISRKIVRLFDLRSDDQIMVLPVCRSFLFLPGTIHFLFSILFQRIILAKQPNLDHLQKFKEIVTAVNGLYRIPEKLIVATWANLISIIYEQLYDDLKKRQQKGENPGLLLSSENSAPLLLCSENHSTPLFVIKKILNKIYVDKEGFIEKKEEQQQEEWKKTFLAQVDPKAHVMTPFLSRLWSSKHSKVIKLAAMREIVNLRKLSVSDITLALIYFPGTISIYYAQLFYVLLTSVFNKTEDINKELQVNNFFDNLNKIVFPTFKEPFDSNKNYIADQISFNKWHEFIRKIAMLIQKFVKTGNIQNLRFMYDLTFSNFDQQIEDAKFARQAIQRILLDFLASRLNRINDLVGQSTKQWKFSMVNELLDAFISTSSNTDSHPEVQEEIQNLFLAVFRDSILTTAHSRSLIPCEPILFYTHIFKNTNFLNQFFKIFVKALLSGGHSRLQDILDLQISESQDVSIEKERDPISRFTQFTSAINTIVPYVYKYQSARCVPPEKFNFDQFQAAINGIFSINSRDNEILRDLKKAFLADANQFIAPPVPLLSKHPRSKCREKKKLN